MKNGLSLPNCGEWSRMARAQSSRVAPPPVFTSMRATISTMAVSSPWAPNCTAPPASGPVPHSAPLLAVPTASPSAAPAMQPRALSNSTV